MLQRLARNEPVRLYLYGLAAALTAALLVFGLVDGNAAAAIMGVASAALAVPAVETARSKVSPVKRSRKGA